MNVLLFFSCGLLMSVSIPTGPEQTYMRERLAAEEASKRHFMQQASQLELTVERMHQEQKRLEVVLARREGVAESMAV
jgi:truncated hemoglobin YjbI